jgi:GTP-binding protein LepA
MTASIKEVADTRVGDTITHDKKPPERRCRASSRRSRWCSAGSSRRCGDFEDLRDAMGKLRLNDASFTFEMETSAALGFGFRCGFLGLLHLEIIRDRLEREFDLDLITTAPSVVYHIYLTDGDELELHNPADMPDVPRSTKSRSRGSRRPSWCRTSISATS